MEKPMKPVTANLKIYYQRPALYFWYFIILCQVPGFIIHMISHSDMQHQYGTMFHLIMSMLFGMVVGSLQKDIFSRPVTFCLPGHRKISHKLSFVIGALFTLIPVAMMFRGIMFSANNTLLTAAAVWLAGMVAYLLTMWLTYQRDFSNRPSLAGGIWLIAFFGILFGGHQKLWLIALESPMFIIIPSLALIGFFWFYFHKESHVRSFCGQQAMTMFTNWNMQKINAYRVSQFAKKAKARSRISSLLEEFITGKMKSSSAWKNKAALGSTYTALDRMITASSAQLLYCVLFFLFLGYLFGMVQTNIRGDMERSTFMLDIFFIMPLFGALMHSFPVHSTLHIPANRKHKFYASLSTALCIVIFATVFVGAAVGLANIIAPYMPEISLSFITKEAEMKFFAPELSHLYITPMIMPLGFAAAVLFGNKKTGMLFAGPVIYFGCFIYVMSQAAWNTRLVAPAIFAVSWLGFIAVLRWHCMKRNLV